MAPRTGTARPREIDFSAVGKAGRRTGITLPQQRLDENGLEEISHMFSSPRKPSPLKKYVLADSIQEEESNAMTPKPALSSRRTPRASVPCSASPRKSGIGGTARRSNGLDIRSARKGEEGVIEPEEQENAPPTSPTRANQAARRFSPSPEKTPLRDITTRNTPMSRHQPADAAVDEEENIAESVENSYQQQMQQQEQATPSNQTLDNIPYEAEDVGLMMSDGDNDGLGEEDVAEEEIDGLTEPLPQQLDDDEVDQSFAPEPHAFTKNLPNSRRKRKSDLEMPDSSPAAKRARKESPKQDRKGKAPVREPVLEEPVAPPAKQAAQKAKPRQPPKNKTANAQMSARQEKELEDVVERIKSRPGPPKSLYVLRRETPADDGVQHTRSGRVSFKPLAYWRNERCVWGGSPKSASLQDGARFPLNSIKEIIRTDQVEDVNAPKRKRGRKGSKAASSGRSKTAEPEEDSSIALDEDKPDPDAEEWENEVGTFRGPVAVWDPELQAPLDEEEEIDIAYAPAAIETTEVRNSSQAEQPSFKYAKLLGNKFMGVGLVDLPPGGIKRPKNSRKMHMSFYVVKGRVTVNLGMSGTEGNRFSIGKGGFWQVPRGNQYSIENELDKPARIFFSQGCEVEVGLDDD